MKITANKIELIVDENNLRKVISSILIQIIVKAASATYLFCVCLFIIYVSFFVVERQYLAYFLVIYALICIPFLFCLMDVYREVYKMRALKKHFGEIIIDKKIEEIAKSADN